MRAKRRTVRRGRLALPPAEVKTLRMAVYDRAGGICEGQVTATCPVRLPRDGFEWHHRKLRSQGGGDCPENSVALCRDCHQWAHQHPKDAKARGLIVPPWADPAAYALTLPDGRVVRLTTETTYDTVFDAHEGDAA